MSDDPCFLKNRQAGGDIFCVSFCKLLFIVAVEMKVH